MEGTIFNIQKFCVNDGPGIRTTVFLKGCPLNCLWCHNPESKATYPEILFDPRKCILCGACLEACQNCCHLFEESTHTYARENCRRCGACSRACVTEALETAGRTVTAEEVLAEDMKDEIFYKNSGGGMTLSGGEPMAQPGFTQALLAAAKEKGLHTCMETCGYTAWSNYEKLLGLVDIFLFDYKLTDPILHKQYTGVSNTRILENLEKLDAAGANMILRCPIIPTINDTAEHFAGIAATANRLSHVSEIHIEPYHPLGSSKSALLDKEYALGDLGFPEKETVEDWICQIQALTQVPVRRG